VVVHRPTDGSIVVVALDLLLVGVGLLVLAKAADLFVVGAARLALTLRISPVVVGAVVLGFGTGTPELLVSGLAARRGSLDLAVGTIVGSNLANLTLVLGVAAVIAIPETAPRVVRREAPLSLAAVVLFGLLVQGGLTRREGLILLLALAVGTALMLRSAAPEPIVDIEDREAEEEFVVELEERVEGGDDVSLAEVVAHPHRDAVLRTLVGLAGTVVGAQLLVGGAQGITTAFGLDGGVVGLTVVAVGTSIPELVTAIQSARRNETALLAGNVLGSNLFNSTAVAGVSALVGPAVIPRSTLTGIAVVSMIAAAVLAWLFLTLGGRLRRWEGTVLLAVYFATLPLVA
jgi:cation:H+ antiporter